MHYIQWKIDRPEKQLVEAFRELPTAVVSDAMGRQNSMRHDMKPLFPGARLCGPALTVKSYPSDNLMPHKALQIAQPGDVLVIEAGHHLESALWGDLISRSAQVRGVEGVVIDGGVRDRDDIAKLGLPVFCTAVLPGGTYKSNPGSINIPVSVAGLPVTPGDIVLGDSDGVVVVPRDQAADVLKRSQEILQKEEDLREKIDRGELIFDILELQKYLNRPDVTELNHPDK
jgi:4-hydroxy-4-methyl-2-oxoglutarate aldolase